MTLRLLRIALSALGMVGTFFSPVRGQISDPIRELQVQAVAANFAEWGYWGTDPGKYMGWTNHSNRLIPVWTYGGTLDRFQGSRSTYRNPVRLQELYGEVPKQTLNPSADYFDQTDIFRLQLEAAASGKRYIFLVIFDGMDWQTVQAAAIFQTGLADFPKGRGRGLNFIDYQGAPSDFGFFVTSAQFGDAKPDVDRQVFRETPSANLGGYSAAHGGPFPWSPHPSPEYLLGTFAELKHIVTDSAGSATSFCSGIKTYNSAINMDIQGRPVEPIARILQREGYLVGMVTSVPFNHATPACAYANNLDRDDYQDIARDLLGLASVTHRTPLPGADVVVGAGAGELKDDDREKQGLNYVPGNKFVSQADLAMIDRQNGGRYVVAQRTAERSGIEVLTAAAETAAAHDARLFGMFGISGGHLPYRTADGRFDPVKGEKYHDQYTPADLFENPTLAEMTRSALNVLGHRPSARGFWLMVEAGDVDWANHNNNIDDSIGAVISGAEAFQVVVDWIEERNCWNESLVIVTADHGHFLNLTQPEALVAPPLSR